MTAFIEAVTANPFASVAAIAAGFLFARWLDAHLARRTRAGELV